MRLDEYRTSKCITANDVPQDEPLCVEIDSIDTEFFDAQETLPNGRKAKVEKQRHILRLRGWRLPLRLNNTKIAALIAAAGVEHDHELPGKRILIQTFPVDEWGEEKLRPCILAVPANKPHHQPLNEMQAKSVMRGLPPGPGSVSDHQQPRDKPRQLAAKKDVRPIGKNNAAIILERFKEKKTTLEKCMYWLKMNDRDGHDAMVNMELETIPAWTLQSIKFYIESIGTPPELVGSPNHNAPAPEEPIDVPF